MALSTFGAVCSTIACRSAPTASEKSLAAADLPALAIDADGVRQLFPRAPGSAFRLGNGDPNRIDRLEIEKHGEAVHGNDGPIAYWTTGAYPLDYSSGGTGKTIRLHIHASGTAQAFTWKSQHGYLSGPDDLKNQEFTAYVRVHGIFDRTRAAVTLKVRGGAHTDRDPDQASCTMMTFAPAGAPAVSRFGKELRHPEYDYVPLPPAFAAALEENRWVGLKLVTFAPPSRPGAIEYRLYVDPDPFDGAGHPANQFRLFSEYVDAEGKNTGHYSKLADWGGWQTTLRTDGIESLDFAILSVREIAPVTSGGAIGLSALAR